jgi:exodeoxyribonuclease VII large subunit
MSTHPSHADTPRILTVSQVNLDVQGYLESGFPLLWVEGELSNVKRPASGHLYCSLKDEQAQVSAAMFRGRNRHLRFTPEDGTRVLVRARVSLYVPRGQYQLLIEHMEEAGEGRLRRAFEELRERLFAEGLFNEEHKQALPRYPEQIGVISSASGAALRDILQVLRRRCPGIPVLLYPAAVQGEDAPRQLRSALALAQRRRDCDVLILGRGGGSLEDLWAFNEEQLARDVAASTLPVVSAVGHEVDTALTDHAADVRAPTPSAAAELVGPDMAAFERQWQALAERLHRQMNRRLTRERERLNFLRRRLVRPEQQLRRHAQQLDELEGRLRRSIEHRLTLNRQRLDQLRRRLLSRDPRGLLRLVRQRLTSLARRLRAPTPRLLEQRRQHLGHLSHRLETASPLATLNRGYSITLKDGQPLRSVWHTRPGDVLRTRLPDGELVTRVEDQHEGSFGVPERPE